MIKADSVLELLAGERIFSVEVSPSKRDIYFTEMNGMSYIASLNKLGLGKLIDELQDIHESMKPPVIRTEVLI